MTRIADLSQNKIVTSLILDTQNRLADKQAQISSNQKSQDYAGISSDSMQLVSLETSERRMEQYLTDNVYVDLRLNGTLNSIDSLKHSITDIRGILRSLMVDGKLAAGVDKDTISDVKTQFYVKHCIFCQLDMPGDGKMIKTLFLHQLTHFCIFYCWAFGDLDCRNLPSEPVPRQEI